jgi:hypothetical protein
MAGIYASVEGSGPSLIFAPEGTETRLTAINFGADRAKSGALAQKSEANDSFDKEGL